MLVTKVFEILAVTVAKGVGFDMLKRYVFPHPLNPLPEEKIRAIARERVGAVVQELLQSAEGAR